MLFWIERGWWSSTDGRWAEEGGDCKKEGSNEMEGSSESQLRLGPPRKLNEVKMRETNSADSI